MPNVLVAIPFRSGMRRVFLDQVSTLAHNLSFPNIEVALFPNAFTSGPGGGKYAPNAAARNALINSCLNQSHTHVLWIDADLVRIPKDLVESLLSIDANGIVAPFVFVELVDATARPSHQTGGWFYDTGGFVRQGGYISPYPPHWSDGATGIVECDSVGCCYLIPADVYRAGCRYESVGREVEHVAFMRQAKSLGYSIWATDKTVVEHAFLPKYGDEWH